MIQSCTLAGTIAVAFAAQTAPASNVRPAPTNAPAPRQQQEAQVIRPRGDTLSDEQRAKLREATEKSRQQQMELYESLRNVRSEVDNLAKEENYNEAAIRSKAQEIGKLEGDLALLRAKQYKELRGILPKAQFDQMHGTNAQGPALQQRLHSIVARTNLPPNVRPLTPTNKTAVQVAPKR